MAGSKIQIITEMMLKDNDFRSKAKSVEQELKKLSTSSALLKLKLDDSDFRKILQKDIEEAQQSIRKTFNTKKGQDITYRNAKGNTIKIDTEASMRKASQYALEQSVNKDLSNTERNKWEARRKALEQYLAILNTTREAAKKADREMRAVESGRIKGVRDKAARDANQQAAALRRVLAIEKEIAREKARNKRNGGDDISSIHRQIELYHSLANARKKAGDALGAKNARFHINDLHKQAVAVERLNNLFGRQGRIMTGLQSVAARYFSIYTVANFARKVAETTGYFQQQQVALEGILGSAAKARDTLAEIKNFALQSPFQTKELVTFTKQLAAFGVGNNDLFPTVKKLADISAGLGVDMSRIILAYGQVKSAAVLRGQELRQFTEAGIPMVQKLADKFTELNGKLVTTGDVFKLISERQVPFEMVAQVLSDMTAEGGQFYKMQENITNTTYGQIQKLKDLWTLAMDEMGKTSEGPINKIIKGLQNIVKNIQPIFSIVAASVVGRALGNAVTSIYRIIRALKIMRVAAAATRGVMASIGSAIGFALGAIGGLWYNARQKSKEFERSMNEVADAYDKDTKRMTDGLDGIVKKLSSTTVGTKKYNEAVSALSANYGKFVSNDITEALMKQGNEAQAAADKFIQMADAIKESIRQQQEWKKLQEQAETAAGKAGEKAGEDTNKETSTNFITGSVKTDILSEIRSSRVDETGIYYSVGLLQGIKDFLGENERVTETDLRESISEIFGNVFNDIANEGSAFEDSKDKIKAEFIRRVSEIYGIDGATLDIIANNAISTLSEDAISKFNTAAEKYALANSTRFAKLTAPFREFDKELEGDIFQGKDAITRETEKYNKAFGYLSEAFKAGDFEGYENSELQKLIDAQDHNAQAAYDVVEAIRKFGEGKDTGIVRDLSILSEQFKNYVEVRSERPAQVAQAFRTPGSKVYDWRNDKDLANIVATYGAPTDNDFQKLREQLATQKKELKEQKEREKIASERAKIQKQIDAIEVLQGVDLYAYGDKPTKSGSSSGGGWRRMFADLFGWIKEAREEEKKLVEFSAGYTEELKNQVNDEKLVKTAVRSFFDGSPFAKFIANMDEYGIETEVFSSGLKDQLEKVVAEQIKETGTIDFEGVWNQLLNILTNRANELEKMPGMSKTVEALRTYIAQMTIERDKYLGGKTVESLIEQQLRELRSMNSKFDAIRSDRGAFNRLAGASNYLQAQSAIYGDSPYRTYFASKTSQRQLQSFLYKDIAGGLSNTFAGIDLIHMLNGGDLSINSLGELSRIRKDLTEEINNLPKDSEEFKNMSGALGQFDTLFKQLFEDIIKDFEEFMKFRDPITKTSDDIVNAYKNLADAKAYIDKAEKDGTITGDRATNMRIGAAQSAYRSVAADLPKYIDSLYGTQNGGISRTGRNVGAWLSDNTAIASFENRQAEWLEQEKAKIEASDKTDVEKAKALQDATGKAAAAVLKFKDGLSLASAIISKIDGGIQKAAKAINATFDALEASNGIYLDSDGNYKKKYDYGEARAFTNSIAEFSSGVSSAFQSFLSFDIFGGIMGLWGSVSKLAADLFGIGDARIRKQQEENTYAIKSLDRQIEELNHNMHEAVGNLKFDSLVEEIKLLREKEAKTRANADLELQMKSGDPEKAQGFRDEADELKRQIEELAWEIQDTILGTADELASSLTDAFVEAFKNGENAARAWRDTAKEYVGDVLKEILMKNILAKKTKEILDSVGLGENTTSEEAERILKDENVLRELIYGIYGAYDNLASITSEIPEIGRNAIFWNSDTSALSGGIQGITEDTARTLEGLSNSMLAQLVLINRSSTNMEGFAELQVNRLQDILVQQRAIRAATEGIRSDIADMRSGIRPLAVQMQ